MELMNILKNLIAYKSQFHKSGANGTELLKLYAIMHSKYNFIVVAQNKNSNSERI